MSFVFLSYSRDDAAKARKLVTLLAKERIDVFWDQSIRFGNDHRSVISDRLETAGCVLVLWSHQSVNSHWVMHEAEVARQRGTLMEAKLEAARIPPPFGVLNMADLALWSGGLKSGDIRKLIDSVGERVKAISPDDKSMSLGAPRSRQAVTDAHLALIHTCWRSKKHDSNFGNDKMYRWDLVLYGSRQALDRVEEVTYFLHPAYELPDDGSYSINRLHSKTHRTSCFLLKQLANGHSLVRANVKIRGQPEILHLSRYINLFDAAEKIEEYFE